MTETAQNPHMPSEQTVALLRLLGATIFYSAVIGIVVRDMWGLGAILQTTGWPIMFLLFVAVPYSIVCIMVIHAFWMEGGSK